MNIVVGVISLDIYLATGRFRPGGGCLNVAYHLNQQAVPFTLISRIGKPHQDTFLDFLQRHKINYLKDHLVGEGQSSSIDIAFAPNGDPLMDNVVEGVWDDFEFAEAELEQIRAADYLHTVLGEGMIAQLPQISDVKAGKRPLISADFLSFRHYSNARFADTLRYIDFGFIGWQGATDDPQLDQLREEINKQGKHLIITLGSRGVLYFDGQRQEATFFPVEAVAVTANSVGCGDAFIGHFLASWWTGGSVAESIEQGKKWGAAATSWPFPLPVEAYDDSL